MAAPQTVVAITDELITCARSSGLVERVRWDDLVKVEIMTTDQGPMFDDVFWVLYGRNNTGCVIPMGAKGERKLIDRLQKLPSFDNEAMIAAMSSANNARFLCWEKG
jgi:hypothetical protein